MRITELREATVALSGQVQNAVVDFSEHTVSLVAVITDVIRHGRPVTGIAFNSIGRFAQSGILRTRLFPRVLAAAPDALLDEPGQTFDPAKVAAAAMKNEKPGGHGDRAGAVAALELAVWDLNAKLKDEPAFQTIAGRFGHTPDPSGVPVYAAGGYYAPGKGTSALEDEIRGYTDLGFRQFKIKIGGAPLVDDLARIEAVAAIAGGPSNVSVDANGRFSFNQASTYSSALAPYGLRWLEEVGDPLDYKLNAAVVDRYPHAIATGENLFSAADVRNLTRYAGMRVDTDVFQMDPGLSYGLGEFVSMMEMLEASGYRRAQMFPHGGHLINLHVVTGLGLGGCEAYPGVFAPFGGYLSDSMTPQGRVRPPQAPGFGLEMKPDLAPHIQALLA